jgi:hypothetical protein
MTGTCETCGGEGRVTIAPSHPPGASFYEEDCDDCGGSGEIEENEMANPAPRDRVYIGMRPDGPGSAKVFIEHGSPLNPRFDLRRHSPDGFEWGYYGSGPAQLALALLCDATGDDAVAQQQYQPFKVAVVALLKDDRWRMTAGEIQDFITEEEGELAHG